MNELELKYYKSLYEKRKNWTKTLLDYEARGVWVTIIDKYTDPVHFIYELLQNADDANASKVFIRLEKDGFIFNYNNLYIAYDHSINKVVGVICAIDKSVILNYDYANLQTINDRYNITVKKYRKGGK